MVIVKTPKCYFPNTLLQNAWWLHEACMLEKYFDDILLNIAYIIIVCYFRSFLLLFSFVLFSRQSHQTHTPIFTVLRWNYCSVFFLCVYYCVCFRTPTFLLRPHSYFPVVSCVLPHPYFVASSFLFRFEYQQSLVRCLFPFEYQPLLVRWQFLHCPIFPRSCWDRIRHHTVPIRSMPVCVHIFPSY